MLTEYDCERAISNDLAIFKKRFNDFIEDREEHLKKYDSDVLKWRFLDPLFSAKEAIMRVIEIYTKSSCASRIENKITDLNDTVGAIIDMVKNGDIYKETNNTVINLLINNVESNVHVVDSVYNSRSYFLYDLNYEDDNPYTSKKIDIISYLAERHKNTKVLFMPLDRSDNLSEDYCNVETEKKKIEKFAIYNDIDYEIKRDIYEKVAIGNINNIICTNSAFDITDARLCCTATDGEIPLEKTFSEKILDRAILYTKDDGYILINVNKISVDKKLLSTLAANGEVVTIFYDSRNKPFIDHDEYLILYKRKRFIIDSDGNKFRQLREQYHDRTCFTDISSFDVNSLFSENDIDNFNASPVNTIRIFKGNLPDIHRLENVINNSTAFSADENILVVEPKPLLPFTKGQVGQVLVSGNLNGIIEEGNGVKHVIKGSVKKDEIVISEEYQSVEDIPELTGQGLLLRKSKKYMSNSVHLATMTANGEYKLL